VAQYDSGGLIIAHYIHGLGLEARVDAGGSTAAYDFDLNGNVTGLTDATKVYVNRYSYSPFGETTTLITPTIANPFTFVGRYGVSADGNGLFNMRARSYDALAGAFVSNDPLGLSGGDSNIRRYVGNNPINFIDPSGLKCEDDLKELNELDDKLNTKAHELGRTNLYPTYDAAEKALTAHPNTPVKIDKVTFRNTDDVKEWRHQFDKLVDKFLENGAAARRRELRKRLQDNHCPDPPPPAVKPADKHESSPPFKAVGTKPTKNTTKSQPSSIQQGGGFANSPSGNGGKVGKGPEFGPTMWNAVGTSQLPYSIHTQNPSTAQAAQTLHVTSQLDADFDPATFRLGEIDLGDLRIRVPDDRTWYETRIDARSSLGVFINVSAGVDLATGLITWDLAAIDPATSDVSNNPSLGLLLPDGSAASRYARLYYSVGPRSNVADGASLDGSAAIAFNGGTPVNTNVASNIVDAKAPVVTFIPNPLPVKSPTSFNLTWTGDDGAGGTGVAYYNVYYQVDGGSFALWATNLTGTSVKFKGKAKHAYGFTVVAFDNAGNNLGVPTVALVTTNT
jgi:RHS repeat-associated protein